MICYLCSSGAELRPYGPRGEMVCFPCAMKPANKATTERQFSAQLEASGPFAVIGNEAGPFPADNDPTIRRVIAAAPKLAGESE